MRSRKADGFTLMELMIVATLIAILMSIAIPSFLAATVRAKVSAAHADMTMLAIALEAYYDDMDAYPMNSSPGALEGSVLLALTTPIRYYSTLPRDIFGDQDPKRAKTTRYGYLNFMQIAPKGLKARSSFSSPDECTARYMLMSNGPDGTSNFSIQEATPQMLFYDPTNGTISLGDIYRIGPQ